MVGPLGIAAERRSTRTGSSIDVNTASGRADPRVSILVPCYNEENFIGPCLESVISDFVVKNCELLVLDGGSSDGTRRVVAEYAMRYPFIRLLDNPGRLQSRGMNVGLKAARGDTIVRLDAHSAYPPDYVERCCGALETSNAANVGGMMVPVGSGMVQEAVARAMSHPAGIGGSKFHLDNFKGYVDTAYLGTFRHDILNVLGGYDPAAHPAEDAELNCRILALGEKVYLDNSIRVQYHPRDTFARLMKQFFWYGRGRCYVILKHRRIFTLGRLAPPLLVVSLLASVGLSVLDARCLLVPLAYMFATVTVAATMWWGEPGFFRRTLTQGAVLATMHLSYGTGFLLKLFRLVR